MLHFALVLRTGGYYINTCRVDACVSQYICELGNIFFNTVKSTSEKMAKIVWKHLAWRYIRLLTTCLHFLPNMMSADRFSASGYKYRSGTYPLLLCITEQFFLIREQ